MKKIGIVGGVAWQSTVDYYSELCRLSQEWIRREESNNALSTVEISIESLDLARAVSYLGSDEDEQSWKRFDEYHRSALGRLEQSGADIAVIASVTPHHRFESIVQGITIPVIDVIEEVAKECVRRGLRHVLVLGTPVTMRSPIFRRKFADNGIEALVPQEERTILATERLILDLQEGKLLGADKRIKEIVTLSLRPRIATACAVCLGCTELHLAYEDAQRRAVVRRDGILFINAAAVHVQAAFNFAVNNKGDTRMVG